MFEKSLLIKEEPKKYPLHYVFIITVIFFLIICNVKTYEKYTILSQVQDNNTLKIITPENIVINEETIIKYHNKQYQVIDIENVNSYIENNEIFKEIILTTNINSEEKIIKFDILNNKQRIITKIINKIKEN